MSSKIVWLRCDHCPHSPLPHSVWCHFLLFGLWFFSKDVFKLIYIILSHLLWLHMPLFYQGVQSKYSVDLFYLIFVRKRVSSRKNNINQHLVKNSKPLKRTCNLSSYVYVLCDHCRLSANIIVFWCTLWCNLFCAFSMLHYFLMFSRRVGSHYAGGGDAWRGTDQ